MERNRKQKENKDRSIGDDARIAGLPGGMDNARIKEREEWITKTNTGERMDNIGRKSKLRQGGNRKQKNRIRGIEYIFLCWNLFFLAHLIILIRKGVFTSSL